MVVAKMDTWALCYFEMISDKDKDRGKVEEEASIRALSGSRMSHLKAEVFLNINLI